MKLSEYLRRRRECEQEVILENQADKLSKQLLAENAESGGMRYPTVESLWQEAIRRAEQEENK